jgi:hypothetical protein
MHNVYENIQWIQLSKSLENRIKFGFQFWGPFAYKLDSTWINLKLKALDSTCISIW